MLEIRARPAEPLVDPPRLPAIPPAPQQPRRRFGRAGADEDEPAAREVVEAVVVSERLLPSAARQLRLAVEAETLNTLDPVCGRPAVDMMMAVVLAGKSVRDQNE